VAVGAARQDAPVAQQSLAVEHAVPSAWQAGVTQLPEVQSWPLAHAWAHDPQLRGSLVKSASVHAPSTQTPLALHVRVSVPHVPQELVIVAPLVHIAQVPATHAHEASHVMICD
jgi:hypothetical protein